MTREEAKAMFRNDVDAYGKPKGIMKKIDKIFDDFEAELKDTVDTCEDCKFLHECRFTLDAENTDNVCKFFIRKEE